jgi:hypothetical protein
MTRCVFTNTGPTQCVNDATTLVHHRYGQGWYCDRHADWVLNRWRNEPAWMPKMVPLGKRGAPIGRRPVR